MVSLVLGWLFVVLGLVAGVVLVGAPIAGAWLVAPAATLAAGVSLWILFPLFFAVGYALVVVGTRSRDVVRTSFVLTALLLPLALAAGVALVLDATSLHAAAGTASLWFVLVVAGVFGALGTAAGGRARDGDVGDRRLPA